MNMRQIRQQLRTVTGRFDLVTADGKDQGADFYINAGVRLLDRLTDDKKAVGRFFQKVSAGSYLCTFTKARTIRQVYVAAESGSQAQLTKLDFADFYKKYARPLSLGQRKELPEHYTPALLRPIPEEWIQTDTDPPSGLPVLDDMGWIVQYMDVMTSDHYAYNGILIGPSPSAEIMVEVVGEFYSKELSADSDENFWTVQHPEVLIAAAMYQMEIPMRNTQGMKDALGAVEELLFQINKDAVMEEATDVTRIKG